MTRAEADELGWRYWARRPAKRTLDAAIRAEAPITGTLQQAADKAEKRAKAQLSRTVEKAAENVGRKTVDAVRTSAPTAAGVAGAAAAVGQVAAAAAVGYFLGMAVRPETVRLSRELRQAAIDQAYRTARRQLADQLGRTPAPDELKPLSDAWKKATAENVARVSQSRSGVY